MTHATRIPRWLAIGAVLLVANSAYLAAFSAPSLFYYTNVGLHAVFGAALAIAAAVWLVRARPALPVLARIAAGILALGALIGFVIIVTGATRAFRPVVVAHVAVSGLGLLALAPPLLRRLQRRSSRVSRKTQLASVPVIVAILAATGWSSAIAVRQRSQDRATGRIVNPEIVPARMEEEGAGARSPFFPSSANTNVGGIIPSNFFMTSDTCARCHKEIYDQWQSSMHHFSSFNNQWYRRSIEYMQDVVGTKPSKWCAGCHDHAVFFNGRFERPIKEQIQTAEAQAGLACTSCHAITHVNSTMGQGDFVIEYPPLHDLAASKNPLLTFTHDSLLYLAPKPHRDTFLKPFHTEQSPEFCAACHKVHLDVPVNGYRWFRGFNEYDNWQASGVSGEGARSFYYPPKPQKCADCHMPLVPSNDPAAKNGYIRSHRFAAANTAVPFVNRDEVQLKAAQKFLEDGAVSVDIFGVVRGAAPAAAGAGKRIGSAEAALASTFAVGEESMNFGAQQAVIAAAAPVIGPIDKVQPAVRPGESVRVEIVVRTRKVGHFFPGGTVDAFDVWVELEAVDATGRTIFHSGSLEGGDGGPVEPGAHFYRSLLLDGHGNVINKRNAWMGRSVAYVRLIPPGAADTIHYRLDVPRDARGPLTLRARVNYRKFSWWNTQWAFGGVRDPRQGPYSVAKDHDDGRWVFTGDTSGVSGKVKEIPNIPITVMARAEAVLPITADRALPEREYPDASASPADKAKVRERWNDYGIGLLLQGDLKGAEAAFTRVTKIEPGYADGWVNIARARIQEGNMNGAEEVLTKALTVNPSLAKTHFFLGTALKSLGRYDEAIQHLRTAAEQYPRDRVVLNQLGRVLFLERRYADAVDAFKRVLAIDPEDLQAHYNLMLCYRGLGRADAAAREQVLYERFKADEASQSITGPYRQLHPEDNNERQQIHEHRSASPTKVYADVTNHNGTKAP